ncbi:hypothetical protein AB1Y20_021864 [Prymnesium parvum]|uniref:Uncharacterized protein n=1 Tax=Prymnesium parvum TaxID=97485 RepID=A0AB34JML8_PRYPA
MGTFDANNSLSHALLVLRAAALTAAQWAALSAGTSYAAVVLAQRAGLLPRRGAYRSVRWAAPLGCALTAAYVGARAGVGTGLDEVLTRTAGERRAARDEAEGGGEAEGTVRRVVRRFSHRERERAR